MRPTLAVVLLAAVLTACSGSDGATVPAVAATGGAATAQCDEVETVPLQGEGHLVGDQEPPVPYNSTPPTSGWHTSGDVEFRVADAADPLTEPEQVTVLELGGVVITHNGLDVAAQAELERIVVEEFAGRAAMTPYPELDDGAVALTAWGRLQRCDAADFAAVRAFIETYATAEPGDA